MLGGHRLGAIGSSAGGWHRLHAAERGGQAGRGASKELAPVTKVFERSSGRPDSFYECFIFNHTREMLTREFPLAGRITIGSRSLCV